MTAAPSAASAGLRHRFATHGLLFDLAAELTRVRHEAVVLARAVLESASAAAGARGDNAEQLTAAFKFAFRVHQFSGGFDAAAGERFRELSAMLRTVQEQRRGSVETC